MASVTLAESAKLAQDELVAGVIENIITVNRMFDVLPFDSIEGNSLAYNRENVLGDVIMAGVGTTFSGAGAGKAAATFTKVNSNLTTIMGDAEVNGLIQATRSGDGNDQTAVQIASKAKSAGRKYQDQLVNGNGAGNEFAGLIAADPNSDSRWTPFHARIGRKRVDRRLNRVVALLDGGIFRLELVSLTHGMVELSR